MLQSYVWLDPSLYRYRKYNFDFTNGGKSIMLIDLNNQYFTNLLMYRVVIEENIHDIIVLGFSLVVV